MIAFSLGMETVPQWTVRSFEAADPWSSKGDGCARSVWHIAACIVTSRTFAEKARAAAAKRQAPTNSHLPRAYAVALVNSSNGLFRLVPTALERLWRAGAVTDAELPSLLHHGESALARADYRPDLGSMVAHVIGALSLFVVVGALLALTLGPAAERRIAFVSTEQWLAQPVRAPHPVSMHQPMSAVESVRLGLLKVDEISAHIGPTIRPNPKLSSSAFLAVVPARDGKRLALVADRSDMMDPAGLVLPSSSLPLSKQTLESLAGRHPDLDLRHVLAVGWTRTDALSPYDFEPHVFARHALSLFSVVLVVAAAFIARRHWSRWRWTRRWLSLARDMRGRGQGA